LNVDEGDIDEIVLT